MTILEKLKHFESLCESLPDAEKAEQSAIAKRERARSLYQSISVGAIASGERVRVIKGRMLGFCDDNAKLLAGLETLSDIADETGLRVDTNQAVGGIVVSNGDSLAAHITGSRVELLWLDRGRRVNAPPYLTYIHLVYLEPIVAFSNMFLHLKSQLGVGNEEIFNAFHKFRELVQNGVIPRQNDSE